jgi:hypothetical protein
MNPGDKSDPCFIVNGASTIVMNSDGLEYNDYENYYDSTTQLAYNCLTADQGYGPLFLM